MTDTPDVLQMEAGRELDALVAERVFGATWTEASDPDYELLRFAPDDNTLAVRERATGACVQYGEAWDDEYLPAYSSDTADAWEVRDALRSDGWRFELWDGDGRSSPEWRARFSPLALDAPAKGTHSAYGATAPLAICKAALLACAAAPAEEGSTR